MFVTLSADIFALNVKINSFKVKSNEVQQHILF